MQGQRNSSALAMELSLSCTNPSIYALYKDSVLWKYRCPLCYEECSTGMNAYLMINNMYKTVFDNTGILQNGEIKSFYLNQRDLMLLNA